METFASAVSFSIWPVPVGYLLPCPSTRSGESQSVEKAVLRLLRINCSLTAVPVSFFHVTKNHRRQEGTIHSAQSVVYPERANIFLGGSKSLTRASRRTDRTAPPISTSNSTSSHTPPISASSSIFSSFGRGRPLTGAGHYDRQPPRFAT